MSQRHLLIPLDGSELAEAVLPIAGTLATSVSAVAVMVYDPTLDTGPLINPMWDEDARQAAETYAEGLAAWLRGA